MLLGIRNMVVDYGLSHLGKDFSITSFGGLILIARRSCLPVARMSCGAFAIFGERFVFVFCTLKRQVGSCARWLLEIR